jgi:hypothetical protein
VVKGAQTAKAAFPLHISARLLISARLALKTWRRCLKQETAAAEPCFLTLGLIEKLSAASLGKRYIF